MKRFLVPLCALMLLLSGCSDADESAAPAKQKVTVMLDWTPNTNHSGLYLAKQRGYYDKAGLDVEILQPGEQGGLASLGSGDVDFAVTVQESLLPARAEGVPVVSLAALLSTNTSSLMSLTSENVARPRDLEGKTYGGFGGELEKQLVSNLVQCDGGDPGKVKWANVGDADYRAGLERDQYDFVWVFEGWDVIRLRQAAVPVNTIPFANHFSCIPDWYTPLLATSEKSIADKPDLVRSFTEATARGYEDASSDPIAAADALLAAAPELDGTLVRESSSYVASYYAKPGQQWGIQSRDTWIRFEEYVRNAKLLSQKVDVDKSFTNDFLPKA